MRYIVAVSLLVLLMGCESMYKAYKKATEPTSSELITRACVNDMDMLACHYLMTLRPGSSEAAEQFNDSLFRDLLLQRLRVSLGELPTWCAQERCPERWQR